MTAAARQTAGSTEAGGMVSALENFVAEALQDKYSCASTLTGSDVEDLIGHQRDLALLGANPKEADVDAIVAGSVGARYVVNTTVTQKGDTFDVGFTAFDSRTRTVIASSTAAIPRNDDTADALERFAKQFAEDLTGPKCPGEWAGTVTVVQAMVRSGKGTDGAPFNTSLSLKLTCQLDGTGRAAKCQATLSSTMTGKGVSFRQNGSDNVAVSITVGVINGKASVDVSKFRLKVNVSGNIEGTSGGSTDTLPLGPWHAEGGAARSGSLSGSWSDGAGTTITWNLSGG